MILVEVQDLSASAEVGDGFADIRQSGTKIRVDNLDSIPKKGANVEFASLPIDGLTC